MYWEDYCDVLLLKQHILSHFLCSPKETRYLFARWMFLYWNSLTDRYKYLEFLQDFEYDCGYMDSPFRIPDSCGNWGQGSKISRCNNILQALASIFNFLLMCIFARRTPNNTKISTDDNLHKSVWQIICPSWMLIILPGNET